MSDKCNKSTKEWVENIKSLTTTKIEQSDGSLLFVNERLFLEVGSSYKLKRILSVKHS